MGYRDSTPCKHTAVMPDPIVGDWCCVRCLRLFRQIPEIDKDVPRISTLWQRIKWAFKPRQKVTVQPFVWTVEWGRARENKDYTKNQWKPHWGKSRNHKKGSPADAQKMYPSMTAPLRKSGVSPD